MTRWWVMLLGIALAGGAAPPVAVRGDEAAATSPNRDGEPVRAIYLARHGSAARLVYFLEKHFADAPGFHVTAESQRNVLSIRAASEMQLKEILRTLAELDRPLRQIAVQVLIVDFPIPRKADKDAPEQKSPVNPEALAGTAEEVQAQVREWIREGFVAGVRKFDLRAVESTPAQLIIIEDRGVPNGVTASGRDGSMIPTLVIRNFGTSVSLTGRVQSDNRIQMQISVQDTQLQPPELGTLLGQGVNGPIVSPLIAVRQLNTTLELASGSSAASSGLQTGLAPQQQPSLIVVSARILGEKPPAGGGSSSRSSTEPSPSGQSPSGPAPSGPAPSGPAPSGAAPSGAAPSGAAPSGAAPSGAAPSGATPSGEATLRENRFRMTPNLILHPLSTRELQPMKITLEQERALEELRQEYFKLRGFGNSAKRSELELRALNLLSPEQQAIWKQYVATISSRAGARGSGPTIRSGRTAARSPEERFKELSERLQQNRGDTEALRQRARVAVELNDWQTAQTDLRDTLAQGKASSSDQVALMVVLLAREDHEAAHKQFWQLLDKPPADLSRDSLVVPAFLMIDDSEACRRLARYFSPDSPGEFPALAALGQPHRSDGLDLLRGIGHLLHGQPLLASSTLEHVPRHAVMRTPQVRLAGMDANLWEFAACRAIGERERARRLVNEMEFHLGTAPPVTLAQWTDQVLYRKARQLLERMEEPVVHK